MSSRAKVFEPESVGDPDCGEGGGDDHKALAVEGGPLRGLIRVRSHHRYIYYYIFRAEGGGEAIRKKITIWSLKKAFQMMIAKMYNVFSVKSCSQLMI